MKLKIKNFKCFDNFNINLPDNAISLLTAPSGFGKSSILEAIMFAFWGSKETDIIKIGKRKCEVFLEMDDIHIYRCKPPNTIVVTHKGVELEHPQEFLNKHFQKYNMGFVDLNSQNRLKILSKISGDDEDVDDLLLKIKTLQTEGRKEIAVLEREIQVLQKTLTTMVITEEVNEPTKPDYNDDDSISLSSLEKELRKSNETNMMIQHLEKEIYDVIKKINNSNFDNDLPSLKNNLEKLREGKYNYEKQLRLLNQYKAKKIFLSKGIDFSLDLESLDEKLENINSDIKFNDDIMIKIQNIKKVIPSSTNINLVIKNYKGVESKFKCPCCKVPLNIIDNDLVVADKGNYELYKRCKDIVSLESEIKNVDYKTKDLLENIKIKRFEFENISDAIDCFVLPPFVDDKEIDAISKHISYLETLINLREKFYKLVPVSEKDIEKIKCKIASVVDQENIKQKYLLRLKDWKNYIENLERRNGIENDITSASIKLTKYEKLDVNIGTYKRLIIESRNLALKSIINEMNKQLKFFTSRFFDDSPDIIISEFTQTSKNGIHKPLINVTINYKSLSMKPSNLSSGELARVRLALDLVMYKFSETKTPLLLDEVSANLDSELSTKIYKSIRKFFDDRMILVISHQVVEGTFDYVFNEEEMTKCIS